MKNKNIIKQIIAIVVIIFQSQISFAQWAMNGIAPDRWVNTTNAPAIFNVEAVGIGVFTASPLSALHVNSNLLTVTPAFTQGEVFRTDCPAANSTFWRMLRGGTSYGVLFNNTGSNDFQIQSPAGSLLLNSAGGFVGINTNSPTNQLDINGQENLRTVNADLSETKVLVWHQPDGNIRYRDISTFNIVNASNGCSIFSPGNVQWGNNLGFGLPSLINDREINMSNFNVYFKGQFADVNGVKNAIGIGYNILVPNSYMPAKLNVLENHGGIPYPIGSTTAFFYNTYVGTTAISGINTDVSSTASGINLLGIYGEASGNEPFNQAIHTGGRFFASSARTVFGVEGIADGSNPITTSVVGGSFVANTFPNNPRNQKGVIGIANNGTPTLLSLLLPAFPQVGVHGVATGTETTAGYLGGLFEASGPLGTAQFGIYAAAPSDPGFSYAGFFFGDVHVTGTFSSPSDAILKTNITPITNASSILAALNPIIYNYNTSAVPQLSLDNGTHAGLIAQQAETFLPNLVQSTTIPATYDSLGNVIYPSAQVKTLNYIELIPYTIAGHNEQQDQIEEQDSTITALQDANAALQNQNAAQDLINQNLQQQINDAIALINTCCSQGNQSLQAPNGNGNNGSNNNFVPNTEMDIRLNNSCELFPNAPNPFNEFTVINYFIPETMQFAQIIFYNSLGAAIKIVDINDKGEGRLNVYGENLRSGMYSYSLIIDGKVCDTMKMIKE